MGFSDQHSRVADLLIDFLIVPARAVIVTEPQIEKAWQTDAEDMC